MDKFILGKRMVIVNDEIGYERSQKRKEGDITEEDGKLEIAGV